MAAFNRLLLLMCALLMAMDLANAIQQKCAACEAVAAELEASLANEKPRNNIDLRHRLDSKGQREGRVIQYKFSELRVLELLEDLCTKLKDYTLNKNTGEWIKFDKDSNGKSDYEKQEAEAHSKAMTSYCGRLLEKHEDKIASTIKNGEMVAGSVDKVLCEKITKDCNVEEAREL